MICFELRDAPLCKDYVADTQMDADSDALPQDYPRVNKSNIWVENSILLYHHVSLVNYVFGETWQFVNAG